MSKIPYILEKLEGTSVYDVLVEIESAYERISKEQNTWYENSKFTCPSGCGSCCKNFEPDLFESEALYMAAWLLENQKETALAIADGEFPFDNGDKTCPLFDKENPYHCSIYEGRAFICRLFGAAGTYDRTGEKVWRPCKFYPDTILQEHNPPIEKRQYSESETWNLFGTLPPIMSDLIESSVSASSHSNETVMLREILPQKIRFLLWLIDMNGNDNPNGSPTNTPFAA